MTRKGIIIQGQIGLNIFSVKFPASKAGLTTVGYTLLNADGSIYSVRTVAGIVDMGNGAFAVTVNFTSPFLGVIIWDTGDTDIKYAYDDVNITTIDTTAISESIIAAIGSTVGVGSISVTIEVLVGSIPVDGVSVYVTTDSAGLNVVAGTLYTDTFGKVSFQLDIGSYYVWKQKSGCNFTNPESITVS